MSVRDLSQEALAGEPVESVDNAAENGERLQILMANLLPSQFGSALIILVFVYYYWDTSSHAGTAAWVGYMALVIAARCALALAYQGRLGKLTEPWGVQRWLGINYAGVVASSLGWAVPSLLFFNPESLDQQVLLVCSVAGLTAGAVAATSASRLAASTFLVVVLAPLAYQYLVHVHGNHGLGLLILLYLGILLTVSRTVHRYIVGNVKLQRSNTYLINRLMERAEQMEDAQARTDTENEMALTVFDALMPQEKLRVSNVTHHLSSHSAFNGDLLLIETRPDGRQIVMLGDFTGHGLAASLGAIPVSDIFASMTRKGFSVDRIVSEINRKLYTQLPSNVFLAACLVELDPGLGQLTIWNGGLPSVYLLEGADGTIMKRIESRHPPLGILPPQSFDSRPEILKAALQDQLFMATDGLIEQRNQAGEMFGEERLEAILDATPDIQSLKSQLSEQLLAFGADAGQGDDITFVAVRMDEGLLPEESAQDVTDGDVEVPAWHIRLSLDAGALRQVNPVPVLNHVIGEFNSDISGLAQVELAIGELYKNALDHGVMGMESSMKATPEGFEAYYTERERRLQALSEGKVDIDLRSEPSGQGGEIAFEISDSGEGFDHRKLVAGLDDAEAAHGRGVALARSLCSELQFNEQGNSVRGVYRWGSER